MKIVREYPPNIDEIRKHFSINPSVIFTYGDTIYSPNGRKLSVDLISHEEVHEKQQGDDPAGWWRKYIDDVDFRIQQEAEAYGMQLRVYTELNCIKGSRFREARFFRFLNQLSINLSSPIYGNILSKEEAKQLILNECFVGDWFGYPLPVPH